MILSNVEIIKALEGGRLIIDPPPPRPFDPVVPPFNTSAIDLQLADEISRPRREGRPFIIDLRRGKFADLFNPANYENFSITEDQPFDLKPNHFVLSRTRERIELPIMPGAVPLAARVEGRSQFARSGILVHFTAPTIHAGFKGPITLEICNLSPNSVALYPGVYICQLIVEEVSGTPALSKSQFRGQTGPGGAAKSPESR